MIQKIKKKIYALVFWQTSLGDLVNKLYDYRLFLKYTFNSNRLKTKEQFEYYLTKQYHIIEKGLALPEPRPEFGKRVILNLIDKSLIYKTKFGEHPILGTITATLTNYLEFNKEKGVDLSNEYYESILNFIESISIKNSGGTKCLTKNKIISSINFDYKSFINSRSSIRNFSDKEVTENEIIEVFDNARIAPSVCNRQGWKAHVYNDKKQIDNLLTIQNGNRGFKDNINKLIIITGDMRAFTRLESNQVYIDGGIFSMNVLLALHAQGLGAVALNTCLPFVDEKKVKKIGNLNKYEKLIMMIGVGHIKENFKVAYSTKKNVFEILEIHKNEKN